jgi:hypothetical protein
MSERATIEVVPFGPLQTRYRWLGRIRGAYSRLLGRSYEFDLEALPAYGYADQVLTKLNGNAYDLVFIPRGYSH